MRFAVAQVPRMPYRRTQPSETPHITVGFVLFPACVNPTATETPPAEAHLASHVCSRMCFKIIDVHIHSCVKSSIRMDLDRYGIIAFYRVIWIVRYIPVRVDPSGHVVPKIQVYVYANTHYIPKIE